jgi:lysyl-tRNA synthetase class 2
MLLRSVRALLEDKPSGPAWVAGRIALIDHVPPELGASAVCDRMLRAVLEHDGARLTLRCERLDARDLALGDWVRARGELCDGVFEAETVELLQRPLSEPTAASDDAVWGQRGGIALLRARATALAAIREYFASERFVEVETPLAVRSPGLEVHLSALELRGAGERRYLHTSPEYHMKRLLAAGASRIYQLGKVFRQEELGVRHEPEFTLLEWYRAFEDAGAMMRDTEQVSARVARALTGGTSVPGVRGQGCDLAPPWQRLTVREAFDRYAGVSMDALVDDEEQFFHVLATRIEPELGRGKPTFLTRYPAKMAALARLCDDDPSVAERFEAYVDGVELCNAFYELTDAAEQRARLVADQTTRADRGLPPYPIDERFLRALETGLPPCAGNALGVDRLLMLILGKTSIQEVIAFGSDRA